MSHKTVKSIRAEALRLSERLANHPAAWKLLSGTATQDEYAGFLIQTYYYIRQTAPLLRAAALRLRAQERYLGLAELMEAQAEQENGHDQWVLSDLLELGCSEACIQTTPLTGAIKAYVAWNWFMVRDGSPVAFLGTAYVLGLLSVHYSGRVVDALVSANTIPGIRNAVKFLSGHAEVDPRNVQLIEHAIHQVTEPEDCEAIMDSAHTTRIQCAGLFAGLLSRGTVPASALTLCLPSPWVEIVTAREQQVTIALLEGANNKDIADELGCAVDTVRVHLRNIFRKLLVSSRTELVARYIRFILDPTVTAWPAPPGRATGTPASAQARTSRRGTRRGAGRRRRR